MRRRISTTDAVWGGAIALLMIGVIASLVQTPRGDGSAAATAPTRAAPPCPYGYVDQPARGAMLLQRLYGTPDGASLIAGLGAAEVRYCFGAEGHGVVTDDRVLLLDTSTPPPELAPRVAHLLHHVVRGMPYPSPLPRTADCDQVVETAIAREAAGYAVEVRTRRALDLEGMAYEFEADFLAAPAGRGEALIADYLRAHPEGAPGLDGLVSAYRTRCERTQRRRAPRP